MKLTHDGFSVPTMAEDFLEASLASAVNASVVPSVSSIFNLWLLWWAIATHEINILVSCSLLEVKTKNKNKNLWRELLSLLPVEHSNANVLWKYSKRKLRWAWEESA